TDKNHEASQCQEKHAVLLSPVGKLQISGCETGVHEIKLPKLVAAERFHLPSPAAQMKGADPGGRSFDVLHRACMPTVLSLFADSFTKEVLWTLLREVKFGEAISYRQLAERAGNSRAARAVGGAMRSNPIPIIIPCHRVICSSGQIGNYGGGNLMKEWLLSHEKLQKEKLDASGWPRGPVASVSPGSPMPGLPPAAVWLLKWFLSKAHMAVCGEGQSGGGGC
uniref:Methylated-DNA--protein-cysteine methyltransferase n=1 Tax=Pavo cristatus TaxID=9049 RepID=A0A8C9EYZ1_PAVCR